jgi:hypothetical protein
MLVRYTIAAATREALVDPNLTFTFLLDLAINCYIVSPDRLPLVSSAIINVAQDVDEPWPLEVIGHDGKAYNVTMEPGDLVLYESHSIIHGTILI